MIGVNQLGQPMVAGIVGLTVTATCATAGATIYMTRDGTRPTPENYMASGSSPLSIVEAIGNDVKARAYKTRLRASEVARMQ